MVPAGKKREMDMSDFLDCIYKNDNIHEEVKETVQEEITHGIMVSNLAYMVSKELGENDSFCRDMGIAGMLHDIGKLKLNRYLYAKDPDTLVIEQLKYVRMHSTFSYNILKREHYPESIVNTVYHHHENYDGTGYPEKLRGNMISRGARILRVCDVFSALISKRPYREAFDEKSALEMMIDEVSNYDMEVFLAFLRMLHSEKYVGADLLRSHVTPMQTGAIAIFEKEASSI